MVSRLYALLSKRCGWTLEYIDGLLVDRAFVHAEALQSLDNEDNTVALAISTNPHLKDGKPLWKQFRNEKPRAAKSIANKRKKQAAAIQAALDKKKRGGDGV